MHAIARCMPEQRPWDLRTPWHSVGKLTPAGSIRSYAIGHAHGKRSFTSNAGDLPRGLGVPAWSAPRPPPPARATPSPLAKVAREACSASTEAPIAADLNLMAVQATDGTASAQRTPYRRLARSSHGLAFLRWRVMQSCTYLSSLRKVCKSRASMSISTSCGELWSMARLQASSTIPTMP